MLTRFFYIEKCLRSADMTLLARDVAKKVEDEIDYKGQIILIIIRESRFIEYSIQY